MMKLHEAIEKLLIDLKRPLSIQEIADRINNDNLYKRKDEKNIDKSQISSRIRQYNNLFQNINNQVILASDPYWKDVLMTYWYIADVLRGLYSVSEVQFIIATLLYFKRLNDLKDKNQTYQKKALNLKLLAFRGKNVLLQNETKIDESNIQEEFSRIVAKSNLNKETELYSIIERFSTSMYSDYEFGNIFEYLLHLDSLDSNKYPIAYTPKNLRELMISLLDPRDDKTFCDPVSGTGGILVEALHYTKGKLHVKGTEVNNRIAMLSLMNIEMHGFFDTEIFSRSCFTELSNNEEYDYLVGDLPLDGIAETKEYYRLYNQYNIAAPASAKGFGPIVLFILSKLNKTGKAVLTVSESFLFKKGKEQDIRELLIKEDIIETIIGLPNGALRPNTEAKASILVLNKDKKLKNKIKFIRAKAIGGDKHGIDLNIDEIISLNNNIVSENDLRIVETKDLLKDSNLSAYAYDAQYYFTRQMLEEGSGKLLGELVEIRSGIAVEKRDSVSDGNMPYLKIENLSKDILNIYLTSEEISSRVQFDLKYQRSLVSEACLLVARIGDNLKPTYFKPNSNLKNILVSNGVYILIPKSDRIDLEYLYYQLHSSYIKEQISKLRHGSVMPSISISGLKQLLIPYVDLSSQKDFVRSQRANIVAAERAKIEEKIKALGYKEEKVQAESDIIRTLVHQLRPTLLNIDLEVKNIKRIVTKHDLSGYKEFTNTDLNNPDLEIGHLLNAPMNLDMADILQKLGNDTLQLNDVLSTVNKVMSFKLSSKDLEEVYLFEFFKEYLELKKIEVNHKFIIESTGSNFIVQINKASFKDLIDQLLVNADKHAFVHKINNIENRVQFAIKQNKERGVAIIEYQNNGRAFSLSQKDFITPFLKSQTSSGSGIGGNYIYRIVQAHKGELLVKEGLKSGFFMTIEIPLTQNFENE